MTDKQMIIDGIDVSECINRNDLKFASYNCYLNGGCQCKDNPNCYYKQLKRKEQECEELKERLNCNCFDPKNNNNRCISYNRIAEDYERDLKQLDQLKVKNEKMSKGYSKLTEIVSPYIDDFTGFNERLGGFDIVLCIKELLQQCKHLETEN